MTAWIFDMDGTLTVPQHDFGALRAALDLPDHVDILGGIDAQPEPRRSELHAIVHAWEQEHIARSEPAPGAAALLDRLRDQGVPVGVVTRNTRVSALRTLEVVGLADRFDPVDVLGRDCATAKPAPDALHVLLRRWGTTRGFMVGDHAHDLLAGRAAGLQTVWIDHLADGRFAAHADRIVRSLEELLS
jgi:HAD superfamily hydrolase (TIGR01509 family)